MLEVWTRQRVIDLAPDAQSAAAGEQQAASAKWELTERSERALWGAVRGSGKNPYLVAIDLLEPAFKCSCPSRKFPCKHGLGLILFYAEGPERFVEGTAPLTLMGEWDGSALRPLTAIQGGRGCALSRDEREPQVVAFA